MSIIWVISAFFMSKFCRDLFVLSVFYFNHGWRIYGLKLCHCLFQAAQIKGPSGVWKEECGVWTMYPKLGSTCLFQDKVEGGVRSMDYVYFSLYINMDLAFIAFRFWFIDVMDQ